MLRSVFILIQIAAAFMSYHQESAGKATGYSKFRTNAKKLTDTKKSMLLIYSIPGALAMLLLMVDYFRFGYTTRALYIAFAFALHFGKRVGEVQYVHKYSGGMDQEANIIICTAYSFDVLTTYLFASSSPINPIFFLLGHTIFLLGLIGNGYHHYLLANLRTGKNANGDKVYFLPEGGFFPYLINAHYFFEIVGYIGIWVGSGMDAYLGAVVLRVIGYLTGRAAGTKAWYLIKMPEEKEKIEQRKIMVPFYY
jgi:very-long-chain enoyl-CoA reductase